MALAERGLVTVTTRTYPLDAIAEAMEDLREGRIVGRAVIVPTQASAARLTSSDQSKVTAGGATLEP